MRTLVQLSDLHFGRADGAIVDQLQQTLSAIAPDVIAISGDFTQRARRAQFRAARAFLDGLGAPHVVVPGNHDVPLYNIAARFLFPLGGYRRLISANLAPSFVDDEVAVFGTDTTRSLTIKGGRLREAEVSRLVGALETAGAATVKILVAHHPMDAPDHVQTLIDAGVDVFLTGHLHTSAVSHTAERYRSRRRSGIIVEAGTATSTRVRDEPNAFNVLRLTRDEIVVEPWSWSGRAFVSREPQRFTHLADGWQRL
jgi:3',5'-cyclic AMP phosphodiesterase CpdA